MSLRARFRILLSLLGVAVVASLAVAVWSVGLLDREQRWANEQVGLVLSPLHEINRAVWGQAQALGNAGFGVFAPEEGNAPESAPLAERIKWLATEASRAVDRLEKFPRYELSAGVNTTRNIRERLAQAEATSLAWAASRDEADHREALRALYELHELIERLEARLAREAVLAAEHSAEVRPRLALTVLTSVAMVVLLLFVAGSCFRRWVLVKAERLRVAAEHLGRGEFDHRIAIEGDDELDRVARQVNEMASTIETMQAERIERERLAAIGEMARRVAHNIRNPLAGIRSLAELTVVESAPDSPIIGHQRRILTTVDRFGSWLTGLLSVSTPLEVSPHLQPIRPWLEGLVDAHRPMAEDRGVRLTLDAAAAPAEAPIDRRHLEQAVSAVLSNAIEASPPGGRVEVCAGMGEQGWEITVTDEGPGVPPGSHERLFRPYFTTKPGGTGIGLAIAHRVVRDHGGRITAENRSGPPLNPGFGPGATFKIEIPLATGE